MSNSNGYAVARNHGSDRFYHPPAARRNQQLQLQQQLPQRQLQRPWKSDTRVDSVDPDTHTDSGESTLSRPNSVSSSPPSSANFTNLDRLMVREKDDRSGREKDHERESLSEAKEGKMHFKGIVGFLNLFSLTN